jgi:hypothetical protein
MVNPEYEPVEAAHLWPPALFEQWPDTVPMHGITILDALRPNGDRAVHVVHDTEAPVWVLVGLLKCVLADLEARWIGEGYEDSDA